MTKSGHRVRFVGHAGVFEIPFAVDLSALSKISKRVVQDEASYLAAFDAARETIQDVAREAYSNGRKSNFMLTAADFR